MPGEYPQISELGFGMNQDIDRFTYYMVIDKNVGDTVHMVLRRAIDESVGFDRADNDLAIEFPG